MARSKPGRVSSGRAGGRARVVGARWQQGSRGPEEGFRGPVGGCERTQAWCGGGHLPCRELLSFLEAWAD
eukprot:8752822-Lingulodinium_polyedra.AAC.1